MQGIGLFSGKAASLRLEEAPTLSVRFAQGLPVPVSPALALHRPPQGHTSWTGLPAVVPIRNTTLWLNDRAIATVEHVLSALAGLCKWNTCVVLDGGPECPILDGSADGFVKLAQQCSWQAHTPTPLVVRDRVYVEDGAASIEALPLAPGEAASMTYEIDYGATAPWLKGSATWQGDAASYAHQIAPARTFSLLSEARAAQAGGLFAHLTTKEMLVLGDQGVPIDNALRFPDEPARHKLLDLVGDLALVGRPIAARIIAKRSGHALAAKFANALLAQTPVTQ